MPSCRVTGGFCSIRSCFTACRRRVAALLVQFPPWVTVWGIWVAPVGCELDDRYPVGDGVGALGGAPPSARAARPRARRAQPPPMRPAARPLPMPPGPAWPPALDLPRDVGRPPRPSLAPRAARPAQLSAAFQAFARNDSQPLHLGALICQRPLDAGVRHAQTPPLDCDARYNSHG